ncbi:hypothetical protein [Streptomyces sp.]|uniref:hypothetical protein n=1 Tax=Streptomyces sp. TaxID=1931 RepID=UPI002F924CAC
MTTTTMPRRITTLQWVRASLAVRLGLEPEHEGATPEWAAQLRDALTDRPAISRAVEVPTAFIPPVRRPIAALTATPHFPFVDEHLGPLNLGPLEPAHIHDQLIGATR